MWLTKLKTVVVVLLSLAVIAGGVAYHGLAVEQAAKDGKKVVPAKDDTRAILGSWKAVSVEMNGKKDPEGKEFDLIREMKLTFTKDKQFIEPAGGRKEYTYKLGPKQKPKAIDLDGDVSVRGVYALDGDTLKICLPNGGKGGGDRPTAVATRAGDGRVLVVLKREVKEKAKDK